MAEMSANYTEVWGRKTVDGRGTTTQPGKESDGRENPGFNKRGRFPKQGAVQNLL